MFQTNDELATTLDEYNLVVEDHFLKPKYCKMILRELKRSLWGPSKVIETKNDNTQVDTIHDMRVSFTSSQMTFPTQAFEAVQLIEKRLQASLNIDPHSLEPWQAVRYPIGGKFSFHNDCGHWSDHYAGERCRSIIIYLNTPQQGGETFFRALNRKIEATAGRLLIWNNLLPTGTCNYAMIHAGMPVLDGDKTILVTWQHEKRYRNFN